MSAYDAPYNTATSVVIEMPYKALIEDRPKTSTNSIVRFKDNQEKPKHTSSWRDDSYIGIIVDGQPLVIKITETNDVATLSGALTRETTKSHNDVLHSESFLEQLNEVKSRLALSITQIADLFGVTRKSVYDWYEGTVPRPGISCRMNSLIETLATVPHEADLQLLKIVWNIPVSGQSFRSIFNGDYLDATIFQTALERKLHELSPRMVKKASIQRKTTTKFGESHLAEFDRFTDFT